MYSIDTIYVCAFMPCLLYMRTTSDTPPLFQKENARLSLEVHTAGTFHNWCIFTTDTSSLEH